MLDFIANTEMCFIIMENNVELERVEDEEQIKEKQMEEPERPVEEERDMKVTKRLNWQKV